MSEESVDSRIKLDKDTAIKNNLFFISGVFDNINKSINKMIEYKSEAFIRNALMVKEYEDTGNISKEELDVIDSYLEDMREKAKDVIEYSRRFDSYYARIFDWKDVKV